MASCVGFLRCLVILERDSHYLKEVLPPFPFSRDLNESKPLGVSALCIPSLGVPGRADSPCFHSMTSSPSLRNAHQKFLSSLDESKP